MFLKQKNKWKTWQKVVMGVFVCFFSLLFIAVVFGPDDRQTISKKVDVNTGIIADTKDTEQVPPLKISAKTLAQDYEQNEVLASQFYKYHEVIITGKITNIGLDINDEPYVILKGTNNTSVQCVFLSKADVEELKKGQTIKLMGDVDGLMLTSVILRDCQTYIPWP